MDENTNICLSENNKSIQEESSARAEETKTCSNYEVLDAMQFDENLTFDQLISVKNQSENIPLITFPQQQSPTNSQQIRSKSEALYQQDIEQFQPQHQEVMQPLQEIVINPPYFTQQQQNFTMSIFPSQNDDQTLEKVANQDQEDSTSKNSKRLPPTIKSQQNQKKILEEWSPFLDQNLPTYVLLYRNDWKKISKKLLQEQGLKTSPVFLRNYYKDKLSQQELMNRGPKITKFTENLDIELVRNIEKLGFNWIEIANKMDFKDPSKLKNRYYLHIRKKDLYNDLLDKAKQSGPHQREIKQELTEISEVNMNLLQQQQPSQPIFQTNPQNQIQGIDDFWFQGQ